MRRAVRTSFFAEAAVVVVTGVPGLLLGGTFAVGFVATLKLHPGPYFLILLAMGLAKLLPQVTPHVSASSPAAASAKPINPWDLLVGLAVGLALGIPAAAVAALDADWFFFVAEPMRAELAKLLRESPIPVSLTLVFAFSAKQVFLADPTRAITAAVAAIACAAWAAGPDPSLLNQPSAFAVGGMAGWLLGRWLCSGIQAQARWAAAPRHWLVRHRLVSRRGVCVLGNGDLVFRGKVRAMLNNPVITELARFECPQEEALEDLLERADVIFVAFSNDLLLRRNDLLGRILDREHAQVVVLPIDAVPQQHVLAKSVLKHVRPLRKIPSRHAQDEALVDCTRSMQCLLKAA